MNAQATAVGPIRNKRLYDCLPITSQQLSHTTRHYHERMHINMILIYLDATIRRPCMPPLLVHHSAISP